VSDRARRTIRRRRPSAVAGPAARVAGDERGQAAVELALALPVVVLLLLGLLQVALVGRDQLAVELAAREAARAAAVSADPVAAARLAAERVTPLRPLQVSVNAGAAVVTVTVSHPSATDVAMVGRFVGDVILRASVTMAVEPPS
jgi:Flp pilus assembly protein TadG